MSKNIEIDPYLLNKTINANRRLEAFICKKLLLYKRFFIPSRDSIGTHFLRANNSDRTILLRVSFDDNIIIEYNSNFQFIIDYLKLLAKDEFHDIREKNKELAEFSDLLNKL